MEINTRGSKSLGKNEIYENLHDGIKFLKVHYACAIRPKSYIFHNSDAILFHCQEVSCQWL